MVARCEFWRIEIRIFTVIDRNSDAARQREILDIMWSMWFQLPSYGRRANQFVDLIGYFTIKCSNNSPLPTVSVTLVLFLRIFFSAKI